MSLRLRSVAASVMSCALACVVDGPLSAFAQPPAMPQRNLIVEVRQTQAEATDTPGAAATGGAVVTRSNGSITGTAPGSVTTRSRDASGDTTQRLTVLNGGHGSIRLSQSVPLQFLDVAWSPQGTTVLPSTVWQDTGAGFVVTPKWPGGGKPVTVEISVESSVPGVDQSSSSARVLTTVQVPLATWVTIARSGALQTNTQTGTDAATASTQQATQHLAVQLRVSLP